MAYVLSCAYVIDHVLMHLHFSVTSPADLIQLYLVRCDNQMEVTTIES